MMRPRVLQSRTSVCQICDFIVSRKLFRHQASLYTIRSRCFATTGRTPAQKRQISLKTSSRNPQSEELQSGQHDGTKFSTTAPSRSQRNFEKDMREVISVRDKLVSSFDAIPTEQEVQKALAHCEVTTDDLVSPIDQKLGGKDGSAASALLSVDGPAATKATPKVLKFSPATQKYVDQLSDIADSILLHPTVFITPDILRQYVNLQSRLRKPNLLPGVFTLYRFKATPVEGTSPIRYKSPSPNKATNAVERDVADRALQSAIDTKQLATALDIIESTYTTEAFRRNKLIRRGLVPAAGLAAAPFAAYAFASHLSTFQSNVDPTVFTNVAFAGILAYMGFTAMLGVVAVTTSNDQMDRVTWAPGIPLRERWIREEERAAIDKIAGAWGFRETWRRGEEEGQEWEDLREWIGRKGMILDRTELMEGME